MNFIRCREVYERLQDDFSRFLYEKRAMYCLTTDGRYIDDILYSIIDKEKLKNIVNRMNSVSGRLVIRGAGNDYWILKKLYPELKFAFFVDNDVTKQGHTIDEKEVISPVEFYEKFSDYYVLVNSAAANKEIIDDLKKNGMQDEHILNLADCYEAICDKQYFETGIVTNDAEEVFIDGGCYDGRTIKQFIDWCSGDYKKIFAFEPDKISYERIKERLRVKDIQNVKLLNRGLWSSETELSFSENGSQGARIEECGNEIVKTTTIDKTVEDEKVTFIKLGVEGAEYEALVGAKDTIRKYKPKLAISVYHKPEDIFELPELILSINSDYKLYLRHYQLSQYETILYCI